MVKANVLRALYREMARIRVFEETLAAVYQEGKTPAFDIAVGPVPGEMHRAAGQERWRRVCARISGRRMPSLPRTVHIMRRSRTGWT